MEKPGLLLTREFRLVWWGQLVSQVGDGVSKFALLWFVYAITGSPLKTTVIGLLQTLPPIVLGPLIGVLVDRAPKKGLLIGSDLARAILIGLIPCLIAAESFTIERLYGLVLLHAVASAVFGPALSASVPILVGRRHFTAANGLLQGTTSLGVIVGPLLSGLGIAALSSQDVLCLNALTYTASAACFLPIAFPPGRGVPSAGEVLAVTRGDLAEGLRFALAGQRTVLWLTLMAALYAFGTSAFNTLFPVFARALLDLGPVEVGALWSLFGAGLLLASIGLTRLSAWPLRDRILTISFSTLLAGAALAGLAWAQDRLLAAGLMVAIGLGTGTLTPVAWGALQELTPLPLIGRVLALYGTGAMTSAIFGMTAFGWMTQAYGPRAAILAIGGVLAATGLAAAALASRGPQPAVQEAPLDGLEGIPRT